MRIEMGNALLMCATTFLAAFLFGNYCGQTLMEERYYDELKCTQISDEHLLCDRPRSGKMRVAQ